MVVGASHAITEGTLNPNLYQEILQENDAQGCCSRPVLKKKKLWTLTGKICLYSFLFSRVVIFSEMATGLSLEKRKKGL